MLEAEPQVLQALSYNVSNDVLHLENSADFNTSRPIKISVSLPPNRLQAVNHQGTGAELLITPGFDVPLFVAAAAFGAGRLYVNGMTAQNVTLQMSGTGDTVLTGSYGTVNVTSTGTGGIYIAGVNDTVTLDLRGVSNAFVQPGQPTAAITGTAGGINVVQICQSVPFVSVPAPNAAWTCGLQLRGNFTCSNEGTAYTSSASGFVGASGPAGTVPVTTTTPAGTSAFTPSSFNFVGASPAGPGTGTQQQSGSVSPQGTQASSNVAGTGSVSSTAVAGPGGAQTSSAQGGQTTGFQTTGQQTSGATTGGGNTVVGGGGTGTAGSSSTASASSTSTAFASAAPASSATATLVSGGGPASASAQSTGGPASSGVIRVGGNGATQGAATSQACQASALELRMPANGNV
ncbi:cell shape-determining [Chlorella sorokiniana]|uniref:Cell shape-determining n=1 Tax=Chlorella sorokiniana TaxID=3076 RepID=A0A2P6TJ77_CHLSO|nr:cell shape-determining [Chlorella sorokiniana]|eukprot:PRW39301.1 cell shape-determining [Chlorella sorokiniana]